MLLLVLSPVLPNFPVFAEAPPTEAAGGLLIDTTGWDDLSREVIPRVLESSLDMGTLLRYAKSASCTVDVAIKTPQISMPELGSFVIPAGPPSTARATLSWEDANDDGTVTEEEVKVETGYTSDIMIKLAMERAEKELRNLVVLNIVNLLPQSSVKAEKKGQEYEITVNPKKGPPVPMRLTVSADSRITHMEFRTLGAVDTKATLKHVQKAGKWLLTETETTTSSGAPQPSSDKWSIEFRMEGAIPLLARIGMISTSSTGGGTLRTEQEYAFGNWRVVKREQPMEVVVAPVKTEGPLAEPRRTVPAVTEGPSPRVNIPRTEQANNLARDTLFSVGNAYYDLSAVGVTGYEATFALQRDGRMVGSFKLKWEAFGSISIEPEEGQAEEMRGLAEALGRQVGGVVAGGPLSNYSLAADAYAARSADQTVIDATKHAVASDPNVKSDLVFVSPDLQQIRATRTMNDGRTSQISYAGEEFEGKLFVSSTTDTVSDPGATPQRTEYTWTYTKKYGEPFVRSLKWSGTAAGLAGDWAMLLQSIAFQKEVARIRIDAGPAERAKLAREVRVPHTEEANKLAQQVLEAVQKKVYGLKSTGVTGFEATYGVQLGGKEAGTLKATCNLGRPLTATASLEELPGEPTKEQVEAIKNTAELHCRTVMTTLLDVGAAAPDPGAYAIKSGNEYVVDFLEQASKGGVDAAVAIAYLPEGLTGYREIFIAKNGTIIEQSWHVEPREGEFVVTSFTWTTLSPGSEPHRNDFTLAYARKDGELFVSRFETEESMGGRKVPWIGVLKDVTFKRETLAASETEAGADVEIPRNTQTMKCGSGVYDKLAASYYNLSADTDVVAFDAVYALGLGDEPLGTMNVTWDGRKTFSESITVPFPFLASRIQVTFKLLAEAAVADDTAKTIKHLGEGVFSVVAERSFPFAANVYGVKSEGQTTIDVTEFYGLNPLVKKSITYASEDLCKIRNVMSYDDGGVTETVFQGELVEKKHFMSKVTLNKAGTDSPKLEYALTYTPKEGVPFVETAVLETTRAGRRTFLRAELQKVTFGRKERTPETGPPDEPTTTTEPQVTTRVATVEEARKLARETKVPRTQEAKQLASQVLTSIQKQYYSVFHSTSVSGFQVTASVKKDDYDVGDIKITWKRDDPENVDSKPEKKVEDPVTIAIHGMAMELAAIDALMPFVLGPLTSPQAPEGHAVKSGGLCIIDLTEATNSDNLESRLLCVPQDFRRVQEIRSYKDGDVLEWIFNGEAADRMLLIGSATQPMSGPLGGDYQPTNFTWTYTRKGGGIFIKKVVVDQPLMGSVLHWTIQFGDVTFQGGGNVPDIPKDIQNAREPALKNLEEQTRKALEEAMAGQGKWECVVCGYIYDAKKGDPEGDVEPDTPFEDLEDDWTCPDCGGAKDGFEQAD